MTMIFWLFSAVAIAQEGLGTVGFQTLPEWNGDDVWKMQVQQSFWLRPSYLNESYTWNNAAARDYWRQSFTISHRVTEAVSWTLLTPTAFIGSTGVFTLQNPEGKVLYHTQFRHSDFTIGSGLSFQSTADLGWSEMGAVGELFWLRKGIQFDMHTHVKGRYRNGMTPQVQVLLDRKKTERPIQIGGEVLWNSNAKWVGGILRHSVQLNLLRIDTDLRIPVWRKADLSGTQFGIQVSYVPKSFDRNQDRDSDGVSDLKDECTLEKEDFDGFEDEDGCPDVDNDQDNILDIFDRCPVFSEDLDGFEDQDGCPDLDNDQDNIVDSIDRCPNEAETINNYQDQDGCPDQQARNDRDRDGVLDQEDICPFQPETINGIDDGDGCPESAIQVLQSEEDKQNAANELYYIR